MHGPEFLKYTKNHEWVDLDGTKARIGITDHAQEALGDIVFVELPEMDSELQAEDVLGVVESVKSASDIYVPLSGTVIAVNQEVSDEPELINQDAYEAWLVELEISDPDEVSGLMDLDAYEAWCAEEN
ncbi:MAG: glycine cleavage system protein GcvH [Clostridia bacterium]|nr:glycine cleavage system protein GcvH [Eubacteriales bacterium]MDD4460991.1 glycine cleavage system protein GcvH [Eubacteriales bacterium]NCC47956.1 glycine cleavage system protein GcvH [Clostridia bacterium]